MAAELSKWYNIPLNANHIVLSCGAAAAMNVLLHAIMPEGSEMIIISPFFAEYMSYAANVKAKVVVVPSKPDFDLDIDAIQKAITPNTRAIIINTPNNPSGKIYSEATLISLGQMLLKEYQKRLIEDRESSPIFIISDEPYRRISYMAPATAAATDDHGDSLPSVMNCYAYTFIVSSFSKDLSLPGERIGWIAMHPCLFSPELQGTLSTNTRTQGFVNAPSIMQYAVEYALPIADIKPAVAWYKERRDILHKGLVDAGLECVLPEGAFYLFPRVPEGVTDFEFIDILKKHLILAVPGTSFGDPRSVRFAYCVDLDTVQRAVPRLKVCVEEAKKLAAEKKQ